MAAISTLVAAGSAIVGAAGAYNAYEQGKAAKDAARKQEEALRNMPDPAAERAKAEQEASLAANSRLAAKNKARQASSLLAKDSGEVGMLAGKTKLGQ
jgi:hypothetical protein